MKKILLTLSAVLCCTMTTTVLTSCSSIDDNPVVVTDDKPFPYYNEIDNSVRPGDNFYQYAIGQWLNSSDPTPSIFQQIEDENKILLSNMLNTSNAPVMVTLRSLADQTLSDDSKSKALLNERLQMLEQVTTADQMFAVFQTLHALGYSPLLRLIASFGAGRIPNNGITTGAMTKEMTAASQRKNEHTVDSLVAANCQYLSSFGFSQERIAQITENAAKIEKVEMKLYTGANEMLKYQETMHRALSASDQDNITLVLTMMGATEKDFEDSRLQFTAEGLLEFLLQFAEARNNQALSNAFRDYMIYNVMAQDAPFVPSVSKKTDRVEMLRSALERNRYYMYRLLADSYGYDNIYKQECTDILENMRKIFIKRVENLDWMSAPTKAEAVKKAQAMKFFVGYPEQWNDDLTPEITSDNMLDAVTQLRQNALQTITGLRQKNFNDHAWEVWANMGQFTTDNAFYLAPANSLVILPAWITKPRFDTELSDAMFYAFAVTFGHEFCHGFDAGGAEYDADGQQRDWWQADDRAAFEAKQQILIELYNQLDAYPGQKANGQKTLVENMADYGGVELALECYKQKLTEQGFRGEQFDEQIKKLFLAYAQSWKQDYERESDYSKLKFLYERDGHSAAHNRVNGMMRLQDDWYRLFDVKSTDKLYLAPQDRVKIW